MRVQLPGGAEFITTASDGLSNSSAPHWDAEELLEAMGPQPAGWVEIPRFNGSGPLNALVQPLVVEGRPLGCLAACYPADVLPSQNDSLLLQVAANQIALLFRRLKDQDERFGRKLAEDRLRQVEHHYQQVVQLLPAAVYACDNNGRITLYNEAAAKLWGRRPNIGEDLWCGSRQILKTDGSPLPRNECPMAIAIGQGRSVRGQEMIVERPDGTCLSVLVNIDPISDSDGNPAGAISTFQDVTPLKRAQEELKSREQHLRAIVENTPECVKLVAEDGTLLGMNGAGLAMVEADSAEQVIGKNIYDVIAPEYRSAFRATNERVCAGNKERLEFEIIGHHLSEFHADPPAVRDFLDRLARSEKLYGFEASFRCKDGSLKTVLIDSSVLWEDGKFVHTQCFMRDITEKKNAEAALHESEALLESQKDAFQAAMRGSSLEESLEVLVRRAVAFTGGRARAAFYIASPDGKALHHIVGMHEHYAKCVDGYPASGESMACGLAAHTGEPVIARDVEQDPKWESYRWLARQHNFRACWSFPVRTKDGPVLGTLAIYFPEPREPSPREMDLANKPSSHSRTLRRLQWLAEPKPELDDPKHTPARLR